MALSEELGDVDGIANALWSIARIELHRKEYQQAFHHLMRSYAMNFQLERLDGDCWVGLDLGQLLYAAGEKDRGKQILTHSRDGFLKLGRTDWAKQVQDLLDGLQ